MAMWVADQIWEDKFEAHRIRQLIAHRFRQRALDLHLPPFGGSDRATNEIDLENVPKIVPAIGPTVQPSPQQSNTAP